MAFNILDAGERQARIALISERIDLYEQLRAKGRLNQGQLNALLDDMKELARLNRVDRSSRDYLYFLYEYLSDDKNPDNEGNLIPAGSRLQDAPSFHVELAELLNHITESEPNARIGWAAPRGHSKSGLLSNGFPIYSVVFELRKYILIISETDAMSQKLLEYVSMQLKGNEKLKADFGTDYLSQGRTQGMEKDNMEALRTKSGILVEAASMGKQLRGKRNLNARPDLVICDDLESSKNTNTPELREKNLDWFNKTVVPIGDPDKTAILYMGTTVHSSGLLTTILKRGDFKSRVFSAIVSPPERDDLWGQFEEIYRDQDNENRLQDALDFYAANKSDMDLGVAVLWPQRWSYVNLMLEKVNIGSRAFSTEFRNNPIDSENAIFVPNRFTYFDRKDLFDAVGRPLQLDYYQFWDSAVGKNDRADYNAIITIGRDRRTGILYIVDAWAEKCPAHKALERYVEKIIEYRPRIAGIETVAMQFDLYRQLRETLAKRGIYNVKLKPVTPRGRKEDRIELLEPLVENGVIRFQKQQRLLLEMLEQFPNHDNDDLPDALASCVDLCGAAKRRTFLNKPAGL